MPVGRDAKIGSALARLGISRPMALMLFTVFLDLLGIGLIFPIGPFFATTFGASAFDVETQRQSGYAVRAESSVAGSPAAVERDDQLQQSTPGRLPRTYRHNHGRF